jgi:hypothetical protein
MEVTLLQKMTGKVHSAETKELLRVKMTEAFASPEKRLELGQKIKEGIARKQMQKLQEEALELMQPVEVQEVETKQERKNRLQRERRQARK